MHSRRELRREAATAAAPSRRAPLDGGDHCRQQPVEGSDDHGVPVADVGEEGEQAWEVVAGPGQGVGEDTPPTAVNASYRTARFWWSVLTRA